MKSFNRVVYLTINKVNGKKYVGQNAYNTPGYLGSGKALKLAIKKHGVKNFEKIILCNCETQEDTDRMEKFWIKELNTIEEGYNILPGGKGNGYQEYILKMSNALKGENNPMYGKSVKDVLIDKYGKDEGNRKWEEMNYKRSINGKNKGTKGVIQMNMSNDIIEEFNSVSEASDKTGVNINSIREVCNKKRNHAGKFIWAWKNTKNN
jgi:group I intron endonuclease